LQIFVERSAARKAFRLPAGQGSKKLSSAAVQLIGFPAPTRLFSLCGNSKNYLRLDANFCV
jgi:hypothetical protein